MNFILPLKDEKALANMKGYAAILLWSFAALCISWTKGMPPFLLVALSSAMGCFIFSCGWVRDPSRLKIAFNQKWVVWALFLLAVPIHRGFYISALKLAPIIEANLLNYLWPLFIVFFSAALNKQKLSSQVLLGAILCFLGVICIGIGQYGDASRLSFEPGHILAIGSALSWSLYSALTRKFPAAPTDMIGIMHAVTATFFIWMHMQFENQFDWESADIGHFAGIVGLGIAISYGYKLWDQAMTKGDQEKVAVAAYMIPLLSTLWLILFAASPANIWVWYAVLLIIGGTFVTRYGQIINSIRALRRVQGTQ